MFAVRSDYQVVFWNRCMEDWTGISSNEITGKKDFDSDEIREFKKNMKSGSNGN